MNPVAGHLSAATRLAALLGTASLLAMTAAAPGQAQTQTEDVPETVLITGSLIRGTSAIGAPVTNLTPQDFAETGALITSDLFRFVPQASVLAGPLATNSGANIERGIKVNIRGLDTAAATRSLLMVDGLRFPAQGSGQCAIDPSIIPALSLDHIDVLLDGASATYGSDAIGGVINIILKRNMDGAITQARWTTAEGGKNRYAASAVWGRTWDGGQITLSYEWYNETPIMGNSPSKFGLDHRPWGLDDRRPLGSSLPGTISRPIPGQVGGQIGAPINPISNPEFNPNSPPSNDNRPIIDNPSYPANLGRNCLNCYAIPLGTGGNWDPGASGIGPTAPFSASTISWSSFNTPGNSGTNGVRNLFDPYDIAWYDPRQERNGGHITIDQRLTSTISFYGSGFYSNRRGHFLNPANLSPGANNALFNIAVPTFNPYYPSGGAPNNLRVSYNIGWESPSITSFYEIAQRYQLGLNIALPAGWNGRVWYAMTNDQNFNNVKGSVNKAAVSAALGWTINPTTPAVGSTPAIAAWTKPANVPYLNLLCDPTAYTCNSDDTLAYIQGVRSVHERFWINEKGLTFDGPLFDLPGGSVKAAIGATYTSFRFSGTGMVNTGASSLTVPYQTDAQARSVWAVFTQLNVPLFSELNGFPGMRRFELEISWRHDQYSDVGGTSNPKVAFNWSPIDDFTIRGTWGTSFRAPWFGELSLLANNQIVGLNLGPLAGPGDPQPFTAVCGRDGSLPPAGSGAWKLMSSFGPDGTPGSTLACPSGPLTLPNDYSLANPLEPPGIGAAGGGSGASEVIRAGGLKGWTELEPELATNWSIGFEYAPTNNFLSGLNLQVTYYVIKITGVLASFGANNNTFNDPSAGDFAFLVPTDWATSGLPGAEACTSNLLPTACAPFQEAVNGLLNSPSNTVDPQARTLIMWINDGGAFNKGWLKLDGVDFQVGYDWDWGDLGAFNAGIVGTYYLHQRTETAPGSPGSVVQDAFHTTINAGLRNQAFGAQLQPNLRYRARLGWARGAWSVTGFMDYTAHYYTLQQAPPNVNGNFCASNGILDASGAGGTFPCAINDYTNSLPSYYTFDLSLGYNTLDAPANEYLRNIGVQLVIQNLMDRHGSYGYWPQIGGGGNACTCDRQKNLQGRTISLIVTKQW